MRASAAAAAAIHRAEGIVPRPPKRGRLGEGVRFVTQTNLEARIVPLRWPVIPPHRRDVSSAGRFSMEVSTMDGRLVIDADGHVVEPTAGLKKHMGPEFQHRAISEGEAWDRSLGGTLGKQNSDPKIQLEDMDKAGIDVQV